MNHASIGAVLSTSWYLSDVICEAILQHHDVVDIAAVRVKTSQGAARLIAVGLLADQLQSLHQASAPHRDWDAAKAFVGATLGINAAGLENVGSIIDRTELAVTA